MRRTFAVIGFSFFVTAVTLCTLGQKAAQIALPVLALSSVFCAAVRRLRREPALFSSLLAGTAACILFLTAMATQFLPVRRLDGSSPVVTAHLSDLPRQNGGKTVYLLRTDAVGGEPMRCKIELLCDAPIEAAFTDRFTFSARLSASQTPDSDGIWLRAYDASDLVLTPDKPTLLSCTLSVRRYVLHTMTQTLPGPSGAVLAAMLLGDKDAIPADLSAQMRRSGIMHIFCVSGFHLSVFTMMLLRFAERKHMPRQVYVPICAGSALCVMAVTGFSRSCVRAGLMVLLMLLGRLIARRADAINSLGLSLLLMCAADPFSAGDIGLQLSVLGTLGVVCASPYVERIVSHIRIPVFPLRRLVQSVLSTMLLSGVIMLLTLPVTAVSFESVSIIAPLTNAFILFAAEQAMTIAAFSLPFSCLPVFEFLFRPLSLAAGLLARYCTAVIRFFGSLPFASQRTGGTDVLLWIAGVLLLIAAAIVLRIPTRRKIALALTMSVCLLGVVSVLDSAFSRNIAEITALQVGNGTAVLVKSRGQTAMIGCGGTRTASAAGKETAHLDWILLPRESGTETSGAAETLRRIPTDTLVVPGKTQALHPLFFFFAPQVFAGETYRVGDVQADFLSLSASSAVRLQAYGRSMLLLFSPGCDLSLLPKAWLDADMLYVRGDVPPALQAENYACVLLQGDLPHITQAAREICANGGDAVCNGTVYMQKGGYIGKAR